MIMNETDVEKVNDLKVEVVDAWEQHVSLINAHSEIKIKNMVCLFWYKEYILILVFVGLMNLQT